MVKTMIYCILLHLHSHVGVNSKGQSLGNLYQGLWLNIIHIFNFQFVLFTFRESFILDRGLIQSCGEHLWHAISKKGSAINVGSRKDEKSVVKGIR